MATHHKYHLTDAACPSHFHHSNSSRPAAGRNCTIEPSPDSSVHVVSAYICLQAWSDCSGLLTADEVAVLTFASASACADEQRAKAQGKFRLDFSGLKRQHMSARGGREREALDSDFKTEIEEREKALSRAAPNLKALQQFEAVKVSTLQNSEGRLLCTH